MNKEKSWLNRNSAVIYCLCIVLFLGLAISVFFLFGPYACAGVSFGLPAIVLAYALSNKKVQIDVWRTQDEQTKK